MKDIDIRNALKRKLLSNNPKGASTQIIDELGLRHGAARIDIAMINGIIHGFELKSDCDTLQRLPTQVRVFNSVLDRITLVVGRRHINRATALIPEWWGIILAESSEHDGGRFIDVRSPKENDFQDILAVSKLLWREEALSLLEEAGKAEGMHWKSRARIYERLVEVIEPDLIRCRVRHQLKNRANWRFVEPYMSGDD